MAAQANIKAVITAQDDASPVVARFAQGLNSAGTASKSSASALEGFSSGINSSRGNLDGLNTSLVTNSTRLALMRNATGQLETQVSSSIKNASLQFALLSGAIGLGERTLTNFFSSSIEQTNILQNSLLGLNSVAAGFGQNTTKAKKAAQDLAKDGLMTVADAATGLKNLLASGFNLDQAIVLMNRFKDSAAFNRQASLGFGDAVRSATEGIKNGNSILVDNAGVTKNISIILKEHGKSIQDVMNVQSDASVRQALYNGLLDETKHQVGDAAKLTDTYAGKQQKAAAQTKILEQNLGRALQAALLPFLNAITPIITKISNWIEHHQKLSATIAIATAIFVGLVGTLTALAGIIGVLLPIIALVGGAFIGIAVVIAAAIAGIVAVVVVNWTKISEFFKNIWSDIKQWFSDGINFVKDHWLEALGFIIGFFALLPIKLPIYIFDAFKAIFDFLNGIDWGNVFSGIGRAIASAADGIWQAINGVWHRVMDIDWGKVLYNINKDIANTIFDLLEGAINGALHGIPGHPHINLPHLATGAQNFGGGLAMVGERGPELVSLPRGSNVYTSSQSQQMLSSGSPINITIQAGAFMGTQIEARKFATMIMSAYSDAMAMKGMRA